MTVSDRLELEAVDPVIVATTEEFGAQAGDTIDTVTRNEVITGTNVIYAGSNTSRAALDSSDVLTPTLVDQAFTFLKKMSGINIRIKIAKVPDGKDPDEYIKHNGAVSFRNVVNSAKDVDDYLFSRAYDDNCEENGKLDTYKFQEDVIKYGSWLHDDLKREKMATNAASYLGANSQTVLNRMNDLMESEENRQYEQDLRQKRRLEEEDLKIYKNQ